MTQRLVENTLHALAHFRLHRLTDTLRSEKVRYTTEVDRSVHFRFARLFSANV